MTVKERLLAYMKAKNIKVSAFEKNAGLSNGYIRQLKNSPTEEKIESITRAYPDLNRVWLLSGYGEMMAEEGRTSQPSVVITGDGVTAATNSSTATSGLPTGTIDKLIAQQNELISQQSRLISIIERMQAQHEMLVGLQQKRGSEEP